MHVLSVSSLKGGVGKTTIALGLASAALNRGMRVLVIDVDPQCDATTGLSATSEFGTSVAEVIQGPKALVVRRAIVESHWSHSKDSKMDVMVGSPRILMLDSPKPTIEEVWRLEQALSHVESDYDLVIIDTPPSINALTRTAWVASDRVILVSEPSFYSVVAADRARRAIQEIKENISSRLDLLGVVVNRYRPQSQEHEFRLGELKELFGDQLLMPYFEERAALQQATGAARPIHSWPSDAASELAKGFDWILANALESLDKGRKATDGSAVASRVYRGRDLQKMLDDTASIPIVSSEVLPEEGLQWASEANAAAVDAELVHDAKDEPKSDIGTEDTDKGNPSEDLKI